MSEMNTEARQEETLPQEATAKKRGKKEKPKKSVQREILEWILSIVAALLIALVLRTFIAEPVIVDGHSMDYTLADQEVMLVTKFDYLMNGPQRYDVVICHYPERKMKGLFGIETDTNFVKRIVGMPGDKLAVVPEMDDKGHTYGVLYVNGEPVEEPYITNRINYYLTDVWDTRSVVYTPEEPYVVPEGYYFVLGDNRSNSNDSHIIGPISADMIVGHVQYIFCSFARNDEGKLAWFSNNRYIPNGLDYKPALVESK